MTRSLIYEQKAEEIYDLVGETWPTSSKRSIGSSYPRAFRQRQHHPRRSRRIQYLRMDLAAAEIIRVGKEAYTYQYELSLRKTGRVS
ncbi:MAG: hypothetical protein R2873_31235 [Caldilineaceae bacterium]